MGLGMGPPSNAGHVSYGGWGIRGAVAALRQGERVMVLVDWGTRVWLGPGQGGWSLCWDCRELVSVAG